MLYENELKKFKEDCKIIEKMEKEFGIKKQKIILQNNKISEDLTFIEKDVERIKQLSEKIGEEVKKEYKPKFDQ